MNIQLEKLELIKMLTEIENPAIIKSIKKILMKEKKDWWEDLTEAQKEDIVQSELEFIPFSTHDKTQIKLRKT